MAKVAGLREGWSDCGRQKAGLTYAAFVDRLVLLYPLLRE